MNTAIINKLIQLGYKVYIKHYRWDANEDDKSCVVKRYRRKYREFRPKEKGGETEVTIEKGDFSLTKYAICHDKDPFNYSLGVRIALNRIFHELEKGE
jgi:hypothetical protein